MLRDQVFNHPGSLIAGCAIWVPIGLWVLGLLQWAIQGDIDVISAIVGILIGLGLGFTALLSHEPYMAPLILTGVVITMLAFPVVRNSLNKRALDQLDSEAIERAYEVLNAKPGNAPAKFKLAKTIYSKGLPAHALAIAEDAISQMPEAIFPEEHRILKSWRHYRLGPDQSKPLNCLECGHPNPPGPTHCVRCGSWYLLHHARGAWVGKSLAKKFVAAWACLMLALVGIPLAAGSLPPGAAIPVILGLMAFAVAILILTFRGAVAKSA
jgi:hypothetical protein